MYDLSAGFVKLLTKRKFDLSQVLFCPENTGVYAYHLSYTLLGYKLDLWIVPTIEIKSLKGISRGKSE